MITLGVREFDGSSDGRRRFCENRSEKSRSLPSEARRNLPSGSSQSPGVCRKSAGASPRVHRMIDGSSPETRRKKRLTHRRKAAEIVLDLIVVSTLIKLENGR
jgi:hypothetical protein